MGSYQGPVRPGDNEKTYRETGKTTPSYQGPVRPSDDEKKFRETGKTENKIGGGERIDGPGVTSVGSSNRNRNKNNSPQPTATVIQQAPTQEPTSNKLSKYVVEEKYSLNKGRKIYDENQFIGNSPNSITIYTRGNKTTGRTSVKDFEIEKGLSPKQFTFTNEEKSSGFLDKASSFLGLNSSEKLDKPKDNVYTYEQIYNDPMFSGGFANESGYFVPEKVESKPQETPNYKLKDVDLYGEFINPKARNFSKPGLGTYAEQKLNKGFNFLGDKASDALFYEPSKGKVNKDNKIYKFLNKETEFRYTDLAKFGALNPAMQTTNEAVTTGVKTGDILLKKPKTKFVSVVEETPQGFTKISTVSKTEDITGIAQGISKDDITISKSFLLETDKKGTTYKEIISGSKTNNLGKVRFKRESRGISVSKDLDLNAVGVDTISQELRSLRQTGQQIKLKNSKPKLNRDSSTLLFSNKEDQDIIKVIGQSGKPNLRIYKSGRMTNVLRDDFNIEGFVIKKSSSDKGFSFVNGKDTLSKSLSSGDKALISKQVSDLTFSSQKSVTQDLVKMPKNLFKTSNVKTPQKSNRRNDNILVQVERPANVFNSYSSEMQSLSNDFKSSPKMMFDFGGSQSSRDKVRFDNIFKTDNVFKQDSGFRSGFGTLTKQTQRSSSKNPFGSYGNPFRDSPTGFGVPTLPKFNLFDFGRRRTKGSSYNFFGKYTPSVTAQAFNIRAFKIPKNYMTGLTMRPIITSRRKKKR